MHNKRTTWLIAGAAAALVAGVRWCYESSMPKLVPTDAQGGIWIAYSAVMSIGTFVICLILAYGALTTFARKNYVAATLLSVAFLFISGYTGSTLMEYSKIRIALADAADPTTSPERLRQLIGFPTGFGYEIDNRIASHPNSTEDMLRILSRKDQLGTLMCLARNPNTPDDILTELSKNPDKWIRQSLERNPKSKK